MTVYEADLINIFIQLKSQIPLIFALNGRVFFFVFLRPLFILSLQPLFTVLSLSLSLSLSLTHTLFLIISSSSSITETIPRWMHRSETTETKPPMRNHRSPDTETETAINWKKFASCWDWTRVLSIHKRVCYPLGHAESTEIESKNVVFDYFLFISK